MNIRMFLRPILIGSSLLAAAAAQASPSATFQVSATVVQTCTVTAGNLAFGSINVVQNTAFQAQSSIDLTCGNGVGYRVGLDQGQGPGGTTTTRVMTNGSGGQLNYQLYQDDALSINWGNTDNVDTEPGTGNGFDQTITVYGVVLANQTTVPYGTYGDTIGVTVYY
jgi:spore coat protein U-like protein